MSLNIIYIRNAAQIVLDQLSLLHLSNTKDCQEFTQIINSICIFANPDLDPLITPPASSALPLKLTIKQFTSISLSIDNALDIIEQIVATSKNLSNFTPQFLVAVGQIRASVELRFKLL